MKCLKSTIDKCLIPYCIELKQYLLPCLGCSRSIEIWHLQFLEQTYKLFCGENFAFLTVNALYYLFFLKALHHKEKQFLQHELY